MREKYSSRRRGVRVSAIHRRVEGREGGVSQVRSRWPSPSFQRLLLFLGIFNFEFKSLPEIFPYSPASLS